MNDSLTPILDFLQDYADSRSVRLHMPGHKGHSYLGCESLDITEIKGADTLYCPTDVIAASEKSATALFGTQRTLYSCGGSSQSIFAAMWLVAGYAAQMGKAPLVLAARNAHQAFLSALAQTGLDVEWLCPADATALACPITPDALQSRLRGMPTLPTAVYLTSPDYLGNVQPIAELSAVCHQLGVLLVVDNAHGAYLHFWGANHPIDLGADVACDSAHKTLPVLTGGAYLHFGASCPGYFIAHAKEAMLTVGSTSPSYLILASLDLANRTLREAEYLNRLHRATRATAVAKARLAAAGWQCLGAEPLKLTIFAPLRGYTGTELCDALSAYKIAVEFADRHYLVLMMSADTLPEQIDLAVDVLVALPPQAALPAMATLPPMPPKAMRVRDAYLIPRQTLPIAQCAGRTLAFLPVTCPPAVPAVMPGETLTPAVLEYLAVNGYVELAVTKE